MKKNTQITFFSGGSILYYSTASTSEAAYIIGGSDSKDVIAEFKNDAWKQLETLAKARYGHNSISLGDETMIIGGISSDSRWVNFEHLFSLISIFSDLETEIWNLTNENHKVISPTLPNGRFSYGIGLYIVPFDFCTT